MEIPRPVDWLRDAGIALYGLNWRTKLAQDLGVNDRTVRRWATGMHRLPDNLHEQLGKIIRLKIEELLAADRRIRKDCGDGQAP